MKHPPNNRKWLIIIILCFNISAIAQQPTVNYFDKNNKLKYSNLDSWIKIPIKESKILGGDSVNLYGIGNSSPAICDSIFFLKDKNSPWSTSNTYGKKGIEVGTT